MGGGVIIFLSHVPCSLLCFWFQTICSLSCSLTLWKFSISCNKVVDLNLKGHRVFIKSPLEKCNLSLLPEGGRGSVNNLLCPYFSCPIQAREGGGWMRMDQCLLLINFYFLKASLTVQAVVRLHEQLAFNCLRGTQPRSLVRKFTSRKMNLSENWTKIDWMGDKIKIVYFIGLLQW